MPKDAGFQGEAEGPVTRSPPPPPLAAPRLGCGDREPPACSARASCAPTPTLLPLGRAPSRGMSATDGCLCDAPPSALLGRASARPRGLCSSPGASAHPRRAPRRGPNLGSSEQPTVREEGRTRPARGVPEGSRSRGQGRRSQGVWGPGPGVLGGCGARVQGGLGSMRDLGSGVCVCAPTRAHV